MTPAGQRWTRDKPTVAGWYWLRRVGGVTVVEVISVPGYEPKHWIVEGVNLRWSLGNMDGEWLGPITPTDDAALRRAKAEGRIKSMWEAVHIANTYNCDHNHGKKATEAVDNVLLKLYDRIAELEADARAAQIEEGE